MASDKGKRYAISFTKRATKDLITVAARDRERIVRRIEALADEPRPSGIKAMGGEWEGHYRLRHGDYRIIYAVRDGELVIVVVRVGHRREVYR